MAVNVSLTIINVFPCNTLQMARKVFYCLFCTGVGGSQMGVACCPRMGMVIEKKQEKMQ